jgi:hypothetical protein
MDASDIEKKSLEAHVELCAERYRFLEDKLQRLEEQIVTMSNVLKETHDLVQNISHKRYEQIMTWAGGLIAVLLGLVGYLLATFVIK